MSTSAEQVRTYAGPAILSFGFRPLFLFAAAWAAGAMALWAAMLSGAFAPPTAFGPVDWHVHELLYGYLPAVAAGFLLTAVPNWTGRLPVVGKPLLFLVLCWLAGRVVILVSAYLDAAFVAAVDLSFLVALGLVIGREIVAGRNWRNLKVLVLVLLLLSGNAVFHAEAAWQGSAAHGYGSRIGIAAAVFLILLIGGRIVPSFTRNWLARRDPGRLPVPSGRFDLAALVVAGAALALWVARPEADATATLCLLAGGLHAWRLARWAGERTVPEPLVLILHIGYGFVPLGFVLLGSAILWPHALLPNGALHAWTAGAIGVMTLAVMTRASLGHSGRTLAACPGTQLIYAAIVLAALLRVGTSFAPAASSLLVQISALAWIGAFAGFVVLYAPMLARPRHR